MNKDEILHLFFNLFESIDATDLMTTRLFAIISESGIEREVFRLLAVRLSVLKELGIHAVQHKEFENIGRGLFSMHLQGHNFNIRILYSFLSDQRPVLLLTFYERQGKRKTDYSSYIPQALELLKQYTV